MIKNVLKSGYNAPQEIKDLSQDLHGLSELDRINL